MLRSRKFWKGRIYWKCRSWTYYHRLRNPAASIDILSPSHFTSFYEKYKRFRK